MAEQRPVSYMSDPSPPYRGRFAPSPSGPLHFGSLIAATASYCQARQQQGQWYVRIEDVDEPRTVAGADSLILHALEAFGFQWQGEVVYQSRRKSLYRDALHSLIAQDKVYACDCSRQQIRQTAQAGELGYIYPGHCRNKPARLDGEHALRLRVNDKSVAFEDAILGHQQQNLAEELGDFVIRRRDGLFAYQLAVVVDDAQQGITDIIRGADLLDSTPRQIYLQQLLGYPTPSYAHLPLAVNARGIKLSKKAGAAAININNPVPELFASLQFLGQQPPDALQQSDLHSLWQWAINHWSLAKIPAKKQHLFAAP